MENKVGVKEFHPIIYYLQVISELMYFKRYKNENLTKIWTTTKNNNIEFGYWHTSFLTLIELYNLFIKYEITSLIELGAGTGLVGDLLYKFYPSYNVNYQKNKIDYKGFENEYDLVNLGKALDFTSAHYIHKKDILTLTKKDLKYCENYRNKNKVKAKAIYMYDPFKCEDTAINFNKHLASIMIKDQYLFYNCISKNRLEIFLKNPNFKLIEHTDNLNLLQKIN